MLMDWGYQCAKNQSVSEWLLKQGLQIAMTDDNEVTNWIIAHFNTPSKIYHNREHWMDGTVCLASLVR